MTSPQHERTAMSPHAASAFEGAPGPDRHWTSIRFADGLMADALAKHFLGLQQFGMSDLGEVLEVFAQLADGTEESWVTGCGSIAARLQSRRVIVLSALGVGATLANTRYPYRFGCRTFLAGNFKDHHAGESLLNDSGLSWTTVHPGPLFDGSRTPDRRSSTPRAVN